MALLAAPWATKADGTDDQYVRIYSAIQEADALLEHEQTSQALAKYQETQQRIQKQENV